MTDDAVPTWVYTEEENSPFRNILSTASVARASQVSGLVEWSKPPLHPVF